MFETMTTGEKALIGATAIGIAALVFHKPTRNAVGLSDKTTRTIGKHKITNYPSGQIVISRAKDGDNKDTFYGNYMGYDKSEAIKMFEKQYLRWQKKQNKH